MSEVLGALFAILVGMMYLPKVQNGIATQRQIMADVTTAQQQQEWVTAVTNYVNQNMTTLQGTMTTTPSVLSVATVKAANVGLPVGFSGTNPFNQTWTAAISQPSAGNLQVLVFTFGGTSIKDQELGSIARAAAGVGGMIPTNNSGVYPGGAAQAYGAFGKWQIPTAAYGVTGGSPASLLNFTNGTLTNNYLYRNAVPGQPQVNIMNTALGLGGNDINNVGQLNANKVVIAGGSNLQIGNSNFYGDNSGNTGLYQDGQLFIQHHDGSAAGIAIVGNVNSTGTVTANGAQINGDVNTGGWMLVGGELHAKGRIQSDEYIEVNGGATAGAPCAGSTPGSAMIGTSGNGPLFCQSGVWRPLGGALYLTPYILPPNSTIDLGIHLYCATADGGGNSYGGTGLTADAGTNAYGSKMWRFSGVNYGANGPVIFCLDQQ